MQRKEKEAKEEEKGGGKRTEQIYIYIYKGRKKIKSVKLEMESPCNWTFFLRAATTTAMRLLLGGRESGSSMTKTPGALAFSFSSFSRS